MPRVGFYHETLPIRSALPGQEAVWMTLLHMVTLWGQMGTTPHQPQGALLSPHQQTGKALQAPPPPSGQGGRMVGGMPHGDRQAQKGG
jgi:hypothetical protein